MTIGNDNQIHLPSEEPANEAKVIPASPKRSRSALHAIIIILVLLALVAAIYNNWQLQHQTDQTIAGLRTEIDELKQQQNTTTAAIETTEKTVAQSQDTIHNKFTALTKDLHSAMQQHLYQNNDWILLKARYLLELAQINAHWSNSPQATTALLQQADELLAHVQDQRLFAVRQAIAKEIAQVQVAPQTDFAGILSQLDALENMVGKLTIKQSLPDSKASNTTLPDNAISATWRERFNASVHLLEKLVVIRRHDQSIQPLLSPTQETMLRENIRLTLQQAQWAVLQNNDALYQWLLTQAISNVQRFFAQNNSTTETVIKQLEGLKKVHLTPNTVVLEQSLPLLNQVIESKSVPANNSTATDAGDNS